MPVVLLLGFVLWHDRKRPEPPMMLLKAFVCGVVSLGILHLLWRYIPGYYAWIKDSGGNVLGELKFAFFYAALPEEFAKLLMLWILVSHSTYFDEHFDGIVYAVFVGMGFAATENIMYVYNSSDPEDTILLRGLLAVPAHFDFAVVMGYFYTMVKFSRVTGFKRVGLWFGILLLPVLMHGIYDGLLFVRDLEYVSKPVFIILTYAHYIFSILMFLYANRLIYDHLENDDIL